MTDDRRRLGPSAWPEPTSHVAAWVAFKGSGTAPTLWGSVNVLSVDDHGVGDYTVNWLSATTASQYAVLGWFKRVGTGVNPDFIELKQNLTLASGSTRLTIRDRVDGAVDPEYVSVIQVRRRP